VTTAPHDRPLKNPEIFGHGPAERRIHRNLGGISHRTLSKQLRELEDDGVVNRKQYNQIPPKVEYSLTIIGRKLEPALNEMHAWGLSFARRETRRDDH
jgi:DNA-binding HxlR family transcriptional regulator